MSGNPSDGYNDLLPLFAAVIMFLFSGSVFQRYFARQSQAFLFWGAGLFLFGVACMAQGYLFLAWNPLVFQLWYVCGAILNAAWIGHGTLILLFKGKWVKWVTVALISTSLFAISLMLSTPIQADRWREGLAISEQYREIIPTGALVRFSTIGFNIYGVITLIGGAVYSGWLFWRKQALPNRVVGNSLIAFGALLVALSSTLTRFGIGKYLSISLPLAAALMYAGFLAAGRPTPANQNP